MSQSLRQLELEFRSSLLSIYCNYYLFYHSKDEVSSGPGPFELHTVQTKNEGYSAKKTTVLSNKSLTSANKNYFQVQGITCQHSRGKVIILQLLVIKYRFIKMTGKHSCLPLQIFIL